MVSFGVGVLGALGGGPPYEFGAFQVRCHRENGGFQPKFFPRVFSAGLGKKKGFIFSPQLLLKTLGKSGLKSPHFPHGFPLAWAPATQAKGTHRKIVSSRRFSKIPWGELWGKSGLKTPQFTYGYLWPGWLGWPPLPNGLGSLVPQKPWKFLRAGSRNFGWSAVVLPINFWNLGPRPPWPKETIGKMGVFDPDFFPELSPKTLGKKRGIFCFQYSVDPPFLLWFSFGLVSR